MEHAGNWYRRVAWRLARHLKHHGIIKGSAVPISPLQWGPETSNARAPPELYEKLSDEQCAHLKRVVKEVRLISRLSPLFPETLNEQHWRSLLECETTKQRLDQIKFWRKNELQAVRDHEKRLAKNAAATRASSERRAASMADREGRDPFEVYLSLPYGKVDEWEQQQSSMQFTTALLLQDRPSLAVDCRFLRDLSPRGASLTGIQLKYLVGANRDFARPWPLYFVNWDGDLSRYTDTERRHLSFTNSQRSIGAILTPNNYTDLFPHKKIVYLSPHTDDEVETVDADTVYVVGGIVDRVPEKNIHPNASSEAARLDGVACKKLPLDRYVTWKSGTKYLTLTAVQSILYDVFESNGDWATALQRHIPMRNVRAADEKNARGREIHESIRALDRLILAEVAKRM